MNIDPHAKRILCFGDSNTWGYVSGSDHARHSADTRWTGIAQSLLGEGYEIIEEGLNSRTIESDDPRPGKDGRNATKYIVPCIDSHDPLALLVFMLGTNELKAEYSSSPEHIGDMMRRFIVLVQGNALYVAPKILIVSPPLVDEKTPYCRQGDKYLGAGDKSRELATVYEGLANDLGLSFLDAVQYTETGSDGVHITAGAHGALGKVIAQRAEALLS